MTSFPSPPSSLSFSLLVFLFPLTNFLPLSSVRDIKKAGRKGEGEGKKVGQSLMMTPDLELARKREKEGRAGTGRGKEGKVATLAPGDSRKSRRASESAHY